MCWSLLAGGNVFLHRGQRGPVGCDSSLTGQNQQPRITLVAVFVYVFTAFYPIAEGPVP